MDETKSNVRRLKFPIFSFRFIPILFCYLRERYIKLYIENSIFPLRTLPLNVNCHFTWNSHNTRLLTMKTTYTVSHCTSEHDCTAVHLGSVHTVQGRNTLYCKVFWLGWVYFYWECNIASVSQKFKIWKIRKFQKIQILFILLVDVIIILGITSCFSFRNDLVHPQSYGIFFSSPFMSTIGFFKLVFIVRKRTSLTTPFQCSKQ